MAGKQLIRTLRLHNFLSFSPEGEEIALAPLNVLIGPNASGKSNTLAALSILRAVPHDLVTPIVEGGGVREWLWKGLRPAPTQSRQQCTSGPGKYTCTILVLHCAGQRL